MGSFIPKHIRKWIDKCVEKVIRMPPKKEPKDKKLDRTICLVTIALDFPSNIPSEIVLEAINQVRDIALEKAGDLIVKDPRMDSRTLEADCKWSTEAFHYTLEDIEAHPT